MEMERRIEEAIRPSHYKQGEIECIDAMVSAFGKKEVATFCKINAMKYIWRLGHKDEEAQEIGKIKWYLDKYLELTQTSIGIRLDTGEPVYAGIAITEEEQVLPFDKPELLRKGLTDREAENIINKK